MLSFVIWLRQYCGRRHQFFHIVESSSQKNKNIYVRGDTATLVSPIYGQFQRFLGSLSWEGDFDTVLEPNRLLCPKDRDFRGKASLWCERPPSRKGNKSVVRLW